MEIKVHTFKQAMSQEEITRESRKYLEVNENDNITMRHIENSAKREIHSYKYLH